MFSSSLYAQNDTLNVEFHVIRYNGKPVAFEKVPKKDTGIRYEISTNGIKSDDLIILITEEGWKFETEYGVVKDKNKIYTYRIHNGSRIWPNNSKVLTGQYVIYKVQ